MKIFIFLWKMKIFIIVFAISIDKMTKATYIFIINLLMITKTGSHPNKKEGTI